MSMTLKEGWENWIDQQCCEMMNEFLDTDWATDNELKFGIRGAVYILKANGFNLKLELGKASSNANVRNWIADSQFTLDSNMNFEKWSEVLEELANKW